MNRNMLLSPILAASLLAANVARADDMCEDAIRVEVPEGQTVWGKTAVALVGHYDGIEQNLEETQEIAEALMKGGRIYELNMACADEATKELYLGSDTQWVDYGYDIDWGSFSMIRTTKTRFDDDGNLIPELMFRTRNGEDGIYFDNVSSFLMPKDMLGEEAKEAAEDDGCIDEEELTGLTGRVLALEVTIVDHEERITKLELNYTGQTTNETNNVIVVPGTAPNVVVIPEAAPVVKYEEARSVFGNFGLSAVDLKENSRQDSGANLSGSGLEFVGGLAIPTGIGALVIQADVLGAKINYDDARLNKVGLIDATGLVAYAIPMNGNLALLVGGRADARFADVHYAGVDANTSRKTVAVEAGITLDTENVDLGFGVYGGVGNVRTDVDLENYNMTVDPTTVLGAEAGLIYSVGPVDLEAGLVLSKYTGTKTSQDAGQISDVDAYVNPNLGLGLNLGPVELGVGYELLNMGNGASGGNTSYSHVGKAGVKVNF